MTPFLLYHPKTCITGRALARRLGIPGGTKCNGRKHEKFSHIIRWGNVRDVDVTYPIGGSYRPRTFINCQKSIIAAGNKFKSLQILDKAKVPVPKHFTLGTQQQDTMAKAILLGRSFRHSRGTDIHIFSGHGELIYGHDYYVEYIKPHKEYRIHVMGGKILFAQKKYFRPELYKRIMDDGAPIDIEAEKDIIRNNEHGWGFHDMNSLENVPACIQDASIRAVDALGLDFGAVDVISTRGDTKGSLKAFVLEINTAPGLRDRNLTKYAEGLKSLL